MTHEHLLKILNHPDNPNLLHCVMFPEDCQILKAIIEERYGVMITISECQEVWQRYSDKQDAQWLDPKSFTSMEIFEAVQEWAASFFKCDLVS